jgi:hypothetical protein
MELIASGNESSGSVSSTRGDELARVSESLLASQPQIANATSMRVLDGLLVNTLTMDISPHCIAKDLDR